MCVLSVSPQEDIHDINVAPFSFKRIIFSQLGDWGNIFQSILRENPLR